MKHVQIVFLINIWLCFCESYKILGVFPMPAHSHYTVAQKILHELAKRGHEITVITPYPQKNLPANVTEIEVESIVKKVYERKQHLWELETASVLDNTKFITHFGFALTESALEHKNVQKLLHSNESFDLVLIPQFLNEALLGIGYHFKAPVVLLSSMPLYPWGNFLLAQPTSSAYVPNVLTDYRGRMSFWQRLSNSFYDLMCIIYHSWVTLPQHRELVRRTIPGQPDLYEFLNNASLLLVNTHLTSYEALPQLRNTIEIGGLHIEEAKELPEDLKTFVDGSEDGVVVFSMGSNLKSADLPLFKRDALLNAFSKLKQNVIWKWETDELPGKPDNVKVMKWIPQSALLDHPHVKVFITHGGMLSTIESIHYGVPVLGIPIFADQKMNMMAAAARGYGLVAPFKNLNEPDLSFSLHELLNNPKYMNNAKKLSKIMQDEPLKPMDKAIYWIEYVLRHEGAPHLRYPGADLTWYQRNLLDVLALVVVSFVLVTVSICFMLKRVCKNFCYSKKERKRKTT